MQTQAHEVDNVLKSCCVGLSELILVLALFILPVFVSSSLTAAHAQTRKSVTSLSTAEIASLRRGVAKMKSRDNAPHGSADYRRSWIYWANIHNHFGDDCSGPISPSGPGSGMNGVHTFTASNADEQATWCTCEHGTIQFLTWHRMYLWYFERVLQQAADDPALRLPYWDYETNAQLPAAYREKTYVEGGQTVPNPLYDDARQPGLNNGTGSLSPGVTSTRSAMRATSYVPFNDLLQATPHGAVHCAIVTGGCPFGLMGSVPVSAIDPIFYAHHTNIDRLYECWLRVDESARLPNDPSQLNTMYTFIDGDGSAVQRKVGDMLTTAQLHYAYAAGGGCPAQGVAVAQAAPAGAPVTLAAEQPLATVGPTRLGPSATTVPLAVSPSPQGLAPAPPSASSRTYLVIDGLQFDQTPGGLYDVYLQGANGQREHVGVINFFNLAPSGSAAHAGHHTPTQASFRFDVTDAVKQLNVSPNAQPSLVFVPTSGLTSSEQGVAPQPVAPQMNEQANVRFDSARLVSAP
ncbi:MAG TPA: tyrosinase family protein [Xanthobacteraceae bacterium]|nr:tyrosinase family protein [Xanthobacteraceae bacterium]